MADVRLTPQAQQAYEQLERAGSDVLLDAIDDAIDILASDPGDARARRRSFTSGLWGIRVRDRSDDWLVVWDEDDDKIVRVRYIGPDPFA